MNIKKIALVMIFSVFCFNQVAAVGYFDWWFNASAQRKYAYIGLSLAGIASIYYAISSYWAHVYPDFTQITYSQNQELVEEKKDEIISITAQVIYPSEDQGSAKQLFNERFNKRFDKLSMVALNNNTLVGFVIENDNRTNILTSKTDICIITRYLEVAQGIMEKLAENNRDLIQKMAPYPTEWDEQFDKANKENCFVMVSCQVELVKQNTLNNEVKQKKETFEKPKGNNNELKSISIQEKKKKVTSEDINSFQSSEMVQKVGKSDFLYKKIENFFNVLQFIIKSVENNNLYVTDSFAAKKRYSEILDFFKLLKNVVPETCYVFLDNKEKLKGFSMEQRIENSNIMHTPRMITIFATNKKIAMNILNKIANENKLDLDLEIGPRKMNTVFEDKLDSDEFVLVKVAIAKKD